LLAVKEMRKVEKTLDKRWFTYYICRQNYLIIKTKSIMKNIVDVESKIITLRNQQVILDSDVAELYGVETRDINKAVKNNPQKFPNGYVFELNVSEKSKVVENFHHLQKLKFSPQFPKAFTEKGLYMLATILKSPKAVKLLSS